MVAVEVAEVVAVAVVEVEEEEVADKAADNSFHGPMFQNTATPTGHVDIPVGSVNVQKRDMNTAPPLTTRWEARRIIVLLDSSGAGTFIITT